MTDYHYETIDLLYPTLSGIMRGKNVPYADIENITKQGVALPQSTNYLDYGGANPCMLTEGSHDGDPDIILHPVAQSLRPVPWVKTAKAQLLLAPTNIAPDYADARLILQEELGRWYDLGLQPVASTELEFYMAPSLDMLHNPKQHGQCYNMQLCDNYDELFQAIRHHMATQQLSPSALTKEYAPYQYEININHTDNIIQLCDDSLYYKRLIKQTAYHHGLQASFMAKYNNMAGNGMHVHVSVMDAEGHNIFDNGSDDIVNNAPLLSAIAGTIKYAKDAMIFFAPTYNSYNRIHAKGDYAPYSSAWGVNDRSVTYRIPASSPSNRRLEHRLSGADANPYLVLFGILSAMRYGLSQQLVPKSAMAKAGQGYRKPPNVPIRWLHAIDALQQSTVMRDMLGRARQQKIASFYLSEYDAYHSTISSHDYTRYADMV